MRRSAFDILFGLTLAIVAAAIALHGVAVVRGAEPADSYAIRLAMRTFLAVATFAIPLALLVIWLAEVRRVRGLAFWLAAGVLVAGVGYAVAAYVSSGGAQALLPTLASGGIGGLIYWAVAGKRSGVFAAAIDRDSRSAAMNDAGARRRCWLCTLAMLLVGVVPLALIGWQLADRSEGTWPDAFRQQSESKANLQLAAAGVPWATLKIENHIGRVIGTAPTRAARTDGFAKAEAALVEMIGMPGVVAYLQNDLTVAEAESAPPLTAVSDGVALPASNATNETRARRMRLGRSMRAANLRRWTKQQAELKLAEQAAEARDRAASAAADAIRKAETAAAEAAAKAKAEDDARRIEAANRKAEDERRLALEAEREKDAVAAARKAEAEKVEADDNKDAAKHQAPAPPPTNCDAEFAKLFKSTTVQFDRNTAAIDAKFAAFLDKSVSLAKQCADYTIDIAGHADRTGNAAINLATSLARASAVRDALQARGVALSRLRSTGYGQSRPLDPSRNRAAFARNRRVELSAIRTVTPQAEPPDTITAPAVKPLTADACHVRLHRATKAADVHFGVNATRLRFAAVSAIKDIARIMRRCPNHALAINGHADRRGTNDNNRPLSERRANAVRDLLIQRGVAGDRLSAIGHGALMPLAQKDTRASYARNRRVDFDVSAQAPPSK